MTCPISLKFTLTFCLIYLCLFPVVLQHKADQIANVYQSKRQLLSPHISIEIAHVLAAREGICWNCYSLVDSLTYSLKCKVNYFPLSSATQNCFHYIFFFIYNTITLHKIVSTPFFFSIYVTITFIYFFQISYNYTFQLQFHFIIRDLISIYACVLLNSDIL